jgi:hypothetical protein
MADKEYLYITELTVHSREGRPTAKFSKVAEKGRMYRPIAPSQSNGSTPPGYIPLFDFTLPRDIEERVERGEVEVMVPDGEITIWIGDDVQEKLAQMNAQARRELIHRSRGNTWSSEGGGVK